MTYNLAAQIEALAPFRKWLEFSLNCARTVPDALDPAAATILENVLARYDAAIVTALKQAESAPGVAEGYVLVPRDRLETFRNVMCGDWCNPGKHIPECVEATAMIAAAPATDEEDK